MHFRPQNYLLFLCSVWLVSPSKRCTSPGQSPLSSSSHHFIFLSARSPTDNPPSFFFSTQTHTHLDLHYLPFVPRQHSSVFFPFSLFCWPNRLCFLHSLFKKHSSAHLLVTLFCISSSSSSSTFLEPLSFVDSTCIIAIIVWSHLLSSHTSSSASSLVFRPKIAHE